MDHRGLDRRIYELSDDQLETIAQRSADIVWGNFQKEVGKGAIRLLLYLIGLGGAALLAWLGLQGKIGAP